MSDFRLSASTKIKCAMCNTHLVEVDQVQTNEDREVSGLPQISSRYLVMCYKCGGKSLMSKKLDGTTVVLTPSGISYDIIDINESDDIIEYTIKTERE